MRISGPAVEVGQAVALLRKVVQVANVSRPYDNRTGNDVRVYVTADLPGRATERGDVVCLWCRLPYTLDVLGDVYVDGMSEGRVRSCRYCERVYAAWDGLIIPVSVVDAADVAPGDVVRDGWHWSAWDGRKALRGGDHRLIRPALGIPFMDVPMDGGTP